jgi:hypothetical protein
MNSPRRLSRTTLTLVLAAVAALVVGLVSPAAAAAPNCGITWGSLPRADAGLSAEGVAVTGARAGRHDCYDRLVVDLSRFAGFGGYDVGYRPVEGADGVPVPLRGAADLVISLHAPAYDAQGNATYQPANPAEVVPVGGYRTFRQVAWVGSFEGYTILGLGTRARLPFRVMVLAAAPGTGQGARLVVDVAHRW